MRWYLDVLKKYATFSGRASRQELWMFVLFNIIISFGLRVVDHVTGLTYGPNGRQGYLSSLYMLLVFIPGLAVAVRRLHDTGRSGWYLLVVCIPLVGFILLYWYILESNPGDNAYGPNPETAASP